MKTLTCTRGIVAATTLHFVGVLSSAAELPLVTGVELQPLAAQVTRLQDALEYLGAPLGSGEKQQLANAVIATNDPAGALARIQQVLDQRCLFGVMINPEM